MVSNMKPVEQLGYTVSSLTISTARLNCCFCSVEFTSSGRESNEPHYIHEQLTRSRLHLAGAASATLRTAIAPLEIIRTPRDHRVHTVDVLGTRRLFGGDGFQDAVQLGDLGLLIVAAAAAGELDGFRGEAGELGSAGFPNLRLDEELVGRICASRDDVDLFGSWGSEAASDAYCKGIKLNIWV